MKKPIQYKILEEQEFFDLLDQQMSLCNCRHCHSMALLGKWGNLEAKKG